IAYALNLNVRAEVFQGNLSADDKAAAGVGDHAADAAAKFLCRGGVQGQQPQHSRYDENAMHHGGETITGAIRSQGGTGTRLWYACTREQERWRSSSMRQNHLWMASGSLLKSFCAAGKSSQI